MNPCGAGRLFPSSHPSLPLWQHNPGCEPGVWPEEHTLEMPLEPRARNAPAAMLGWEPCWERRRVHDVVCTRGGDQRHFSGAGGLGPGRCAALMTLPRGGTWPGACCRGRACRSICPEMSLQLDPVAPETEAGFACTPVLLCTRVAQGSPGAHGRGTDICRPAFLRCFGSSLEPPPARLFPFQNHLSPLCHSLVPFSHAPSHTSFRECPLRARLWGQALPLPHTRPTPRGLLPLLVKVVC